MTDPAPSDETLVARVASGDTAALEALFDRYARAISGLGWKILGDGVGAEDLVQETFWRVWTRARSYDPRRGKVSSWLFGIGQHLAIDHLRRRRRQPEPAGEDAGEARPDPEADVQQAADKSIERSIVRAAVESLPGDQRRVLELAYFQGLSRREIAEALDLPLGTVHTRARLGLLKLRAELISRGYPG
jgi:RNA polymerase sigma-70 factor (ECF subfamily)